MPSVSNSNYRLGGKRLMGKSVQTIATLAAALLAITVVSRASADEVTRWNKIATDASRSFAVWRAFVVFRRFLGVIYRETLR